MKQNKNKFQRGMLKIAIFATTALFLITNCKKDKDDNKNLLMMLAVLSSPNGTAEFKFSNTANLLAARSKDSSRFLTLPNSSGQNPTFLTDLAGENPQNYGDGVIDGFNDKFLTPKAVGIQVCQIVAYKSVEKGGPAKGTETLKNANFTSFNATSGIAGLLAGDSGPCGAFVSVGLTDMEGADTRMFGIQQIPENEKNDYDRIGVVVRAFTYYFESADVPENSYRYVDLILNNADVEGKTPPAGSPAASGILWGLAERGDVVTPIFAKECYPSYLNSASFIFWDPVPYQEKSIPRPGCNYLEGFIDSNSGSFINGLGSKEHFKRPNDFLNPPDSVGTATTDKTKKLKFKLPASTNSLGKRDPYILVMDLDTNKETQGNLLFNVSADNILFWDSNDGNNVFSPQLDMADRPNATSGEDNLTNTARKNMIFHLPTITSSLK
ncbi:hypothetical protein KQY10_04045 [Leptospira interrogans]|uniref:Lipoprotein n=1 Tax=Leptospira interrogans serovar Hardjo str. Norma TaxID=1279460 RepID=A0A0M4NH09_LEPIR|nr:hypothetical protein [Leptospira interrogans]ALE37884.1 hypothetical protein G436_0665 [Leptospira interrogans serovar Hardjo str. Norma]MCD1164800.1 hypothetical protein [Leptospira interrogans]OOB94266.1 hypothetical protein B0191_12825 [Leptospira interrogans serovar Hardjo]